MRHHWPGQRHLHGHLLFSPAEVQLKPKHQPYKLGRQWPELLLRFTDASDEDVAMGQCRWGRGSVCSAVCQPLTEELRGHLKGALGRLGWERL